MSWASSFVVIALTGVYPLLGLSELQHGVQNLGVVAFVEVVLDCFVPVLCQDLENRNALSRLLRTEGEAVGYIAPRLVLRLVLHW